MSLRSINAPQSLSGDFNRPARAARKRAAGYYPDAVEHEAASVAPAGGKEAARITMLAGLALVNDDGVAIGIFSERHKTRRCFLRLG